MALGKPQVAGTAAFSKFMHVLQLVADAPEPLNVGALMRSSGYPRPTVHRIVAALVAERLLVEGAGAGAGATFALGPRLVQLASQSWSRSSIRLAALEDLQQLRDRTGETVHLAVPNGASMVYIDKLESPSAVRMASRIGAGLPLHSTACGKAYLAALDKEALRRALQDLPMPRFMPHTLTEPAALRKEIELTRERGWSMDKEENEAGIQCFGAAILGADGRPVAALSVSTLIFMQKKNPEKAYVTPLREAAAAISGRIAQTPPLSRID